MMKCEEKNKKRELKNKKTITIIKKKIYYEKVEVARIRKSLKYKATLLWLFLCFEFPEFCKY